MRRDAYAARTLGTILTEVLGLQITNMIVCTPYCTFLGVTGTVSCRTAGKVLVNGRTVTDWGQTHALNLMFLKKRKPSKLDKCLVRGPRALWEPRNFPFCPLIPQFD